MKSKDQYLHEAKGMVLREGVTYTAGGAKPWCKRRALYGRTDQMEFVVSERVVKTTGETKLKNQWRPFRGT